MGASLVVDIGNTCHSRPSLPGGVLLSPSGFLDGLSGALVGDIVDLIHENTNCNVYVGGRSVTSGPLLIAVQTSDDTTSGNFTDPTSGLVDMPSSFSSGGVLRIGVNATTPGIFGTGAGVSGQMLLSGFMAFAHFQRPHRYARLMTIAGGFYDGPVEAGFVSQRKITGSGGGFTYAPGSGSVDV